MSSESLPNGRNVDVYHHATDMMTVQSWPLMPVEFRRNPQVLGFSDLIEAMDDVATSTQLNITRTVSVIIRPSVQTLPPNL